MGGISGLLWIRKLGDLFVVSIWNYVSLMPVVRYTANLLCKASACLIKITVGAIFVGGGEKNEACSSMK